MADPIARLWSRHHPQLLIYLRRRFPRASPQCIEDAAAHAALELLAHPERLERCVDERDRLGLLRCVAWRGLRGELRRKRHRLEYAQAELPPIASPPGQVHAADLARRLPAALDVACARFGGEDPALLRAALEYRLVIGDSDTAVAARFGLRREALNRAKRLVQRRMLEV